MEGSPKNIAADGGSAAPISIAPQAIRTLYQAALSALQAKRHIDAENGFRKVLALDSKNADALRMLGLIQHQKGNSAEAESLIRQALAIREDPFFLSDLGEILRQTNRLQETEAVYRHALRIKPDLIQIQYNLALLYHLGKQLREAEAAYRRVLQLQPDHAFTCYNLAKLLKDSGQNDAAESAYRWAISLNPAHDNAHNSLGNLYAESGRATEAESAFRQALTLNPGNADALFNFGNLLRECGRKADAKNAYRQALSAQPNYADAHNNLGNLLKEGDELSEAEAAYRSALALNPDSPETLNNLGNVLQHSGGRPEAESALRRALHLRSDFPDAQCNLASLLLAQGRFLEAWPYHEARCNPRARKPVPMPDFPFPQWGGETLAGKSLLICPEQGFGDYIQFVRYAPMLKARGVNRLTLLCAQPLAALLATVPGVDAVTTDMQSPGKYDYWVFPLSLPLHFDTTLESIPQTLPYISALPERERTWQARLPIAQPRVGLVWKGNTAHENDYMRSLSSLETLAPLWKVAGVSFVSLQKGVGEGEAENAPDSQAILPLGSQIEDFADTAAIVNQLDLVICVDTAIAHVAGALGKPCWILLPYSGTDWRWLFHRTDTPWYPGAVRLFRQAEGKSWSAVIDEVATALAQWKAAQDSVYN